MSDSGPAADGMGPAGGHAGPSADDPLLAFLLQLARAVQKHQRYPDGHPALYGLGDQVASLAEGALDATDERRGLGVHVHRDALEMSGGERTDAEAPLCQSLARTLHDRHVSALQVRPGVQGEEIERLARWLAAGRAVGAGDGEREDEEEHPFRPPEFEHLSLTLFPYEALRDRRADERRGRTEVEARELWRELAALAHGVDDPERLTDSRLEPGSVGAALARRDDFGEVAGPARRLISRILERAVDRPGARSAEGPNYAERVDGVLDALAEAQIRDLLGSDAATEEEEEVRTLLLRASSHLDPGNLEILIGAANDRDFLHVSDWLLRVLGKLVQHARADDGRIGAVGDREVRRQILELTAGYRGEAFHGRGYAEWLRRITRPAEAPAEPELDVGGPSAERMLEMGLEGDLVAGQVIDAWEEHSAETALDELIVWLAEAPEGDLAKSLRSVLVEPEGPPVDTLLTQSPPAWEAAELVVRWSGERAIPRLLTVLAESEDRELRRFVYGLLTSLGERVRHYALERLYDDRWYVRRNLLGLITDVSEPPIDLPGLRTFLDDPHEAVRREAIRLGLLDPNWRDAALAAALRSDDRRSMTLGLARACEGSYPRSDVGRIAEIAADDTYPVDVRKLAARALAHSDDERARDALLDLARTRDWPWFWRFRLRAGSDLVAAAVSALAKGWAEDPEVGALLRVARASDDPDLRDTVESP